MPNHVVNFVKGPSFGLLYRLEKISDLNAVKGANPSIRSIALSLATESLTTGLSRSKMMSLTLKGLYSHDHHRF